MGKKKKAVSMSEEEKQAWEEQQKLEEQEMRKKKESILAQFLKDKLMHEERATRYNLTKLNMQWRNIMRVAKVNELKQDIEVLSQTFERVIDSKDALIKTLAREIVEALEVYAAAFRSHYQKMDFLLDLQRDQISGLTHSYYLELHLVCQEFQLERAHLLEHHRDETNDIEDILYSLDLFIKDEELNARMEYEAGVVDIKNRSLEEKQELRSRLEPQVEDLWQQFRQILQRSSETNEDRKVTLESLKVKDDKRSMEIQVNMRKIKRLEFQIASMNKKLDKSVEDKDTRRGCFNTESQGLTRWDRLKPLHELVDLKQEIQEIKAQQRENMTRLTVETNALTKRLQFLRDKGASILRLAELCRKLETEEEKVVPFYVETLTEEERKQIPAHTAQTPLVGRNELVNECSGLGNFWKRYNKVLLEKLSLNLEVQSLVQENHQLRACLKKYLDCISVNADTLNQDNSLLIVSTTARETFRC